MQANLLTYNTQVQTSIRIAQSISKEYLQNQYGPPHLLKAMLHNDVGLASQLAAWNYDIHYLRDWADIRITEYPKSVKPVETPKGDERIEVLFEVADVVRMKLGQDGLSPLSLLIAMTKPNVAFSQDQLKSFPLTENDLLQASLKEQVVETTSNGYSPKQNVIKEAGAKALHDYCKDKTALANEGKMDPIIGREKELRTIAEILGRRSKPNVIITGEPGVGKTALVDGFAQHIIEGQVPERLHNALVFELDTGSLIAGASYRGEIEDRIKKIITELRQFDKAILFIDEIHVLLDDKGGFSGVANLLKPALGRGELTIIGATTEVEYRKYIEKDEAFNRRFEQLKLQEPDEMTAQQMLATLIPIYESHHNITVSAATIEEAVRLSKRYIKDRRLPDAAIDLIDRTMSAIKLSEDTTPFIVEKLEAELKKIESRTNEKLLEDSVDHEWLFQQWKEKISPLILGQIDVKFDEQNVNDPGTLRSALLELIRHIKVCMETGKGKVEPRDIAAIVAHKTGIPLGKIQASEKDKLLNMESRLRQRVVGQDRALKVISDAILESRSGLKSPGKPIGSFFMLGPTGTGKTELAKTIAATLFEDENALIRFDMSEFKEKHAAELLIGSPPGFVGFEEGGLLVNKIRQKPYSVLLFDEIEKAHPSIFDLFLQIMDEGKLHDRLGKTGDFTNAIILFTSNIGAETIIHQSDNGTNIESSELMDTMKSFFRPEFLNRLTEIVPFVPISNEHMITILEIQLASLTKSLKNQEILMQLTDATKTCLAESGYSKEYGARPLQGIIRQQLIRPLSRMIISGELRRGMKVQGHINKAKTIDWSMQ